MDAEVYPSRRPVTNQRLLAEFARYYQGNGRDWRGLRFDGMESEPLDAEGARLANLIRELDAAQRRKVLRHAVRMVVRSGAPS
jgi:hypothetical protein